MIKATNLADIGNTIEIVTNYVNERTEKNLLLMQEEIRSFVSNNIRAHYSYIPEEVEIDVYLYLFNWLLIKIKQGKELSLNMIRNKLNKETKFVYNKYSPFITPEEKSEEEQDIISINTLLDRLMLYPLELRKEIILYLSIKDKSFCKIPKLEHIKSTIYYNDTDIKYDKLFSIKSLFVANKIGENSAASKILYLFLGYTNFINLLILNEELKLGLKLIKVKDTLKILEEFNSLSFKDILRQDTTYLTNFCGSYEEFFINKYVDTVISKIESITDLNTDTGIEAIKIVDNIIGTLTKLTNKSIEKAGQMIIAETKEKAKKIK